MLHHEPQWLMLETGIGEPRSSAEDHRHADVSGEDETIVDEDQGNGMVALKICKRRFASIARLIL